MTVVLYDPGHGMEIRALAEKLQALLERHGIRLPIAAAQIDTPAIVLNGYLAGDLYGSSAGCDELTVVHPTLRMKFQYVQHVDSGQCDQWSLEISGASDALGDAAIELFHPRQYRGHFNNHYTPELIVDGVKRVF